MANTSSRTLRLLSLLQSRRYWPGPLLADRLEVSPRTLRRDIDRLRDLGYPVDAQPGVDGGYALAAGASLPPLTVDDDEAMALAVAIQSHLAGAPADGDAALRALAKVVQVMPRRLHARLDAVRGATSGGPWGGAAPVVDHDVLTVLALGCRDTERVRFAYRSADGRPTDRLVEPLRLVPLGRRWYLVAYDLDRHDWRTFRIDRIADATGTGSPFGPRTAPFEDVVAWVREKVGAGSPGGTHHVVVDVEATVDRVEQRFGRWARLEPLPGDRTRLTMDTDTLDGPLVGLALLGADFTVVEPPELDDLAAEWGARLSARRTTPRPRTAPASARRTPAPGR